jgi:hypothetical protein
MPANVADSAALESAIAEFFEAESSGHSLSRDEFLDRHSAIRSELKSFLANHDAMLAVAAPLREALAREAESSAEPSPPPRPDQDVTLDAADPAAMSLAGRTEETLVRLGSYGDYELLKELGRGGMGVVYKAIHTRLKRVVALKMVVSGHLAAAEELDRFRLEAQAAAGLTHAGIVPIFEAGEFQGLPYFSMGLVEGVSLAERIAQGPVPPNEAVRLVRKIVDAVAYAHSHGVIHRDLKPANIMLACETGDSSGGPLSLDACQPQVTDFGLAKRLGVASHLTATGQILGTPSYMPPEQACGNQHEVGEAADIYALGAILYATLSGQPPFAAENPVEVLLQVLEREPARLITLQPAVPPELEAICLKCLEKRPADRYPSAAALGADLDRFLRHEPPEARSATPWQLVRRWVRRQRGLLVVFVLIQFVFLAHRDSDVSFHVRLCATMVGWMVACFVFQKLMERDRTRELSHYLWCAADVWFLTGILAQIVAPRGLLASAYALIICASGLFFRAQIVWFTTLMAMAASLLLLLAPLGEYPPWHYILLFEAVLGICGLAVGYQVWRLEILREYYQERRPS